MKLLFVLIFFLLPTQSHTYTLDALAEFPHFDQVQVILDTRQRQAVIPLASTTWGKRRMKKVTLEKPLMQDLPLILKTMKVDAENTLYQSRRLPRWLKFNEPIKSGEMYIPSSLNSEIGANPETMKKAMRAAFDRVPRERTLPVVIANSVLYEGTKKSNGSDLIKLKEGFNLNAKKWGKGSGLTLPNRPIVFLAHNTFGGIDFYKNAKNASLLLHQVLHAAGLGHVGEERNVMHPKSIMRPIRPLLSMTQIHWLIRWVQHSVKR